MRKERPETKIVLSEPADASLLASGTVQARTSSGSPASSHPSWQPHPIQGCTPYFIPFVLQEVVDKKNYDQLIPVAGSEGLEWATKLAQKEGIMTGISGGASFAVAMKVAENAAPGSVILCMIADSAERYITTPLVRCYRRGHECRGVGTFAIYTGLSNSVIGVFATQNNDSWQRKVCCA